jgi:hypothetical protein
VVDAGFCLFEPDPTGHPVVFLELSPVVSVDQHDPLKSVMDHFLDLAHHLQLLNHEHMRVLVLYLS